MNPTGRSLSSDVTYLAPTEKTYFIILLIIDICHSPDFNSILEEVNVAHIWESKDYVYVKQHSNMTVDCHNSLRDETGSTFRETLENIKGSGCTVLICGAVPRDKMARVSARLLGDTTASSGCLRLFGLTDVGLDSVAQRLRLAGDGDASARVIRFGDESKRPSAAAAETTRLDVDDVPGDVDAFEAAMKEAIAELEADQSGVEPAELCVCVDSLLPLLAEYGRERVQTFLDRIDEIVGETRCMAHFTLPVDPGAPVVESLVPYSSVVVSLRVMDETLQQRWHLVLSDYRTDWFSIDRDPLDPSP